ncbi:MAG: hypothetical protein KF895_02985 [Parvibaculum sp.]|nr:hypothetical protein [Parvibaculum sp.]
MTRAAAKKKSPAQRKPFVPDDTDPGEAHASPVRAASAIAQRETAEDVAHDDSLAELHQSHDMEEMHGAVHAEWPTDWKPPSELDTPDPLPGMTQRWIRTSLLNADDPRNIAKKTGEGWRPRPADTVPGSYTGTRANDPRFGGVIQVAGMVLCHMPIRLARQRNAHYAKALRRQEQSVDEGLNRVEDKRFSAISRTRKSDVETGRRPVLEDDDE